MFNLDGKKVHQTLPGAGWRVLHTDLEDFDVTDDAVIAWVTFKEIDCGSGATWIGPLLKDGMLSDQYGDGGYVEEYLRPDATPEDIETALAGLHVRWQVMRIEPSTSSIVYDLSKGVKRG
jgi:hypothetical protein